MHVDGSHLAPEAPLGKAKHSPSLKGPDQEPCLPPRLHHRQPFGGVSVAASLISKLVRRHCLFLRSSFFLGGGGYFLLVTSLFDALERVCVWKFQIVNYFYQNMITNRNSWCLLDIFKCYCDIEMKPSISIHEHMSANSFVALMYCVHWGMKIFQLLELRRIPGLCLPMWSSLMWTNDILVAHTHTRTHTECSLYILLIQYTHPISLKWSKAGYICPAA